MREHGNHGSHDGHSGHAGHDHGQMVADFRKRFWVCLLLTIPVLALSPMIQHVLGLGEGWRFAGDACEASQQTGFAIPSRLALDGNADLSPTVGCDTTIDGLDKAALAGQQLHLLAGVDAFGYRQALEESNDAAHTRALAFPGSRRGRSDVALRLSCVRTA